MSTKVKQIVIKKKSNIPTFPLYDRLVETINQNNVTQPNPKVWPKINKLDPGNAEIIFFLIAHYANLNGQTDSLPYIQRVFEGGKGVIYNVESLPQDLQIIISTCVDEITK